MSSYFSKVIKVDNRQREFNFRQPAVHINDQYSVDVPDEKGNRIVFSMYRDADGKWKTTEKPSLPAWIHQAEAALGEAIEENIESNRK